jgi:hypothetical protein
LFCCEIYKGQKYLNRSTSEWEDNIKRIFNTTEERGELSSGLGYGLVEKEAVKNMVWDF